jgi:hypothetical protein
MHYDRRAIAEKRRTVNLQILATPLLLFTYIFFQLMDEDLEQEAQAKFESWGAIYAVCVATIILGVLTYFEDLLILF